MKENIIEGMNALNRTFLDPATCAFNKVLCLFWAFSFFFKLLFALLATGQQLNPKKKEKAKYYYNNGEYELDPIVSIYGLYVPYFIYN